MKVLASSVKHVIDFKTRARVQNDGSEIKTEYLKMSMNSFNKIAIAEAMHLKDKDIESL